jgi:hypothetical protein
MAAGKRSDTEEEFAGLDFHSVRLEDRFVRTMETLFKQPDKSIREAGENRAGAKAVHRMLGNEAFGREGVIKAHREAALRRMADCGGTILAAQDTAGASHGTRLKTEGIGYVSDRTMGANAHSCLAASAEGLVLGVMDQSSYNRPEAEDETASHGSRKVRPTGEKESFRWRGLKSGETLERSTTALPCGARVITVCGREGDMAD